MEKERITFGVVGLGRFGQWWAETLLPFGTVIACDLSLTVPKISGITIGSLQEVARAEIVFLLVPISAFRTCCQEIKPHLAPSTLVIDACSVKMFPLQVMRETFAGDQPVMATHPLFGPDSVQKIDFFQNSTSNANCGVAPVLASSSINYTLSRCAPEAPGTSSPEASFERSLTKGLAHHKMVICTAQEGASTQKAMQLFQKMELEIIHASAEEHDQAMARSQALVHFLGRGLNGLSLQEQKLSTPHFHALLKMSHMVERDKQQLFLDMHRYNPFARAIREKLLQQLFLIHQSINKDAHEDFETATYGS